MKLDKLTALSISAHCSPEEKEFNSVFLKAFESQRCRRRIVVL